MSNAHMALAAVFREHAAWLTATMTASIGDFDLAEESVQDALLAAAEHWPQESIPAQPAAWLLTTARRKAIDRLRRENRYRQKLALLDEPAPIAAPVGADEYLQLVFTCCHPALSREAQAALTLRAVMGLTTAEIAAAFLTSETTIAQRIVRAKRTIAHARIPYHIPAEPERKQRMDQVLAVLYLVFNEGYLSTDGESASQRDLAEEATWLTSLLAEWMPEEPEVVGLLALMRLHLARAHARFDQNGGLVLLRDQDRRLWDQEAITAAIRLIERAATMRQPGPYQLQAAIAACHAQASSWEATDWQQIIALYGKLLEYTPSPVVRLNRAIALWQLAGPEAALAEVDCLATALGRYHLFHATRGELLRALERPEEARAANMEALRLARNPAGRALLRHRLG